MRFNLSCKTEAARFNVAATEEEAAVAATGGIGSIATTELAAGVGAEEADDALAAEWERELTSAAGDAKHLPLASRMADLVSAAASVGAFIDGELSSYLPCGEAETADAGNLHRTSSKVDCASSSTEGRLDDEKNSQTIFEWKRGGGAAEGPATEAPPGSRRSLSTLKSTTCGVAPYGTTDGSAAHARWPTL